MYIYIYMYVCMRGLRRAPWRARLRAARGAGELGEQGSRVAVVSRGLRPLLLLRC